jgi:hypothetical protein
LAQRQMAFYDGFGKYNSSSLEFIYMLIKGSEVFLSAVKRNRSLKKKKNEGRFHSLEMKSLNKDILQF